MEDAIAFRKRVNAGLLERIWRKLEEARETPEEPGSGLEDLEDPFPADLEPEQLDPPPPKEPR